MSLKFRDSQGNETPVAGLNGTSGELVPSVSVIRSGTYTPSGPVQSQEDLSFSVTFSEPMPDSDYQVIFGSSSNNASSGTIQCAVRSREATGFTGVVRNVGTAEISVVSGTFTWFAFKLMTDEVHEADSAHIAQNTANFAPAFSDVTSYAVGDYVTYNNVLYRCTTAHTAGTWVAGHFTQVTVGGTLGAIVPSDASASNKLVAHQTPYESFTLNNNSGSQKWYKLGTYMSGNNTARLDFVSARVDGQMFESSVRISGIGADANYISWIGENGSEISIFAIKVDTNRNLYVQINSYSAIEIKVYGVFTLDIAEQSSAPSGAGIPLQKLVTESDLNPVAITTPTPVSGVTGGDNLIYGFKSGKMVTIVLNGIIMANNITQNQPIFTNVPTAVGNKNIYFTVLDYENGKSAVMSIIGNSLDAAFQSDDKNAVHAGRYWGTVTYMTSD